MEEARGVDVIGLPADIGGGGEGLGFDLLRGFRDGGPEDEMGLHGDGVVVFAMVFTEGDGDDAVT